MPTMMVPRAYHFLHQASSSPPHTSAEKMGVRTARTRPSSPQTVQIPVPVQRKEETMSCIQLSPAIPATSPAHSKPVVIPPRTPSRSTLNTQTVRVRGHNGGRSTRVPKNHQPDAIPAAVAALLAVTEIPRMPPRRRKGPSRDRRISMDELIQEWNREDAELSPSALASPSPLDLLLGRVDESEDECGSLQSVEQERESMTSRSVSSESVTTQPPSLELDSPSFASVSSWDTLSTPESYTRSERREKAVQSPPKEDCILDHPLLQFSQDDCEDVINIDTSDMDTPTPSPLTGRFKSFKSNLTASFQAMKSAAKSFSNFTAPSIPPDDLLTRSLLSPMFASEMRPKNTDGLPSPALRRYLNPQPSSITPAELSMQLHSAFTLDDDSDSNAPMIQMQTYDRRVRSSNRRRKNDPFSEAGRVLSSSPAVRQREPRENSNFLRVIVLEMNMRRVGKLDAKAVGKARIWLPPRKSTPSCPPSAHRQTPARWISMTIDAV